MSSPILPTSEKRLLSGLLQAFLAQGSFKTGGSDVQNALAGLGRNLCSWLEQNERLVFLGGNPVEPVNSRVLGITDELIEPTMVVDEDDHEAAQLYLAGFWKDRRLTLISFRQGLTSSEFDHLYHLLIHHAGKGLLLRKRLLEEQSRGQLPHISMLFLDDMQETDAAISWPARLALASLHRDLNLLSRMRGLPPRNQIEWRKQLFRTSLKLPQLAGKLDEFFAHLDLIAENIDAYDKDELAFALMEHLDEGLPGQLCLHLCARLERLQPKNDEDLDSEQRGRSVAIQWITRRLAEQLLEQGQAGPEHFHSLVLRKVLLYEEIPQKMRSRVASLQVLTSFLSNPQKYFSEVESSHSPEVLEKRLWRILEMLPKLIEALRFDVARQVVDFSQRFGPTFELRHKPEIMAETMDAAASVLTDAQREQQASLMAALPQMGQTGVYLLIDLADHRNRSVRRTALDALIKIGPPIVPILFTALEVKQGWHYLRNMIVLLAQLQVGGPKVENLFRHGLAHDEPNVRKEALPGIARLLKGEASLLVAEFLDDSDSEVRKRAASCLGLTGVSDTGTYSQLAGLLSEKESGEDLAMQVVATINRIKPQLTGSNPLEKPLLDLLGVARFPGLPGRKSSQPSATLRVAVVQALGYIGTSRSLKTLGRLSSSPEKTLANAAIKAKQRLDTRIG